jgi:hypothetical protein
MMTSKERLFACALANTPETVRVIHLRRNLSGKAGCRLSSPNYGRMWAPRPATRRALFIFLHECGHFSLHADSDKPRYLEEWEAEQWAITRLHEASISVPRESIWCSKRKIARHIVLEQMHLFGAEIDLRVARYAWGKFWRTKLKLVPKWWSKGGGYVPHPALRQPWPIPSRGSKTQQHGSGGSAL